MLSSSCSRLVVDALVSQPRDSLNFFRHAFGTGVCSLGSGGSTGGSGPSFNSFMQVSDTLARTGASPDVSRMSVEADIPVHVDSDASISSMLLSWLLSVLWQKVYCLVGLRQDLLYVSTDLLIIS